MIKYKANDEIGDKCLSLMFNYRKNLNKHKKLFNSFLKEHGFSSWHFHDGWVMHNGKCGNILHHIQLEVSWHDFNNRHQFKKPKIGDTIVITKVFPGNTINNQYQSFDLYCYAVIGINKSKHFKNEIFIERFDIKKVKFNEVQNKYEFHIRSFWDKIFMKNI
jgi:hypothetical protein